MRAFFRILCFLGPIFISASKSSTEQAWNLHLKRDDSGFRTKEERRGVEVGFTVL